MEKYLYSILFLLFSFVASSQDVSFDDLLFDSQKLFVRGRLDSAESLLLAAVSQNPNSSVACYSLSKVYLSKENYIDAVSYAQRSVSNNSSNVWYLRNLIDIYQIKQDAHNTTKYYFVLLSDEPSYFDFVNAIDYFNSNSDTDNELRALQLAIDNFPIYFDFYKRIIEIYVLLDDAKNVTKYSNLVVSNFSANADAYNLSFNSLADIGDLHTASVFLSNGLSKLGDSAQFHLSNARLFFLKSDFNLAAKYLFDSFVSDNYSDIELVDFLTNNEDFLDSVTVSDSLLSFFSNQYQSSFIVNNFVAEWFLAHNKYYSAIKFFEISVNISFSKTETFINLLNLYQEFNMLSKLDSLSDLATELYPAQPVFYLFKGIADLGLKQYQDAYDALTFGKSLVIDQDDLSASFLFYLSVYCKLQNDLDNYNFYYNDFLSLASGNCDLLAYLTFYFIKSNLLIDKSINLLDNCMLSENEDINHSLSYIYAYALYYKNDFESALNYVNIAISTSNYPNFLYYELLGNILNKAGQVDKAKVAWEKSVQFGNVYINKNM